MIKQLQAFLVLFQHGQELSNAATWKNYQIAANAVIGLLSTGVAIGGGFGVAMPVDSNTINAVGAGIAAAVTLVNAVLTVITSKKVGFPEPVQEGVKK